MRNLFIFITLSIFACKKIDKIPETPITPVVQEEAIKFTTSIDSGFYLKNDTLPITISIKSKIPVNGYTYSISTIWNDSSKLISKIDSSSNQSEFSISVPGLNKVGKYTITTLITSKSTSSNLSTKTSSVINNNPTKFTCIPCTDNLNVDVFGNIPLSTTHPINAKYYGCLIVNKNEYFPTYDGTQVSRFEVRNGDCSGNSGFNDCINDRSRHEINETNLTSLIGKTIIYQTSLYIPTQKKFRPSGNNLLVLSQINFSDDKNFGALSYIVMGENNNLFVQTHKGFTWEPNKQVTINTNPYDKWINIRYEIKLSTANDGNFKVFADNQLLVNEDRATLPTNNSYLSLRLGIYNSFLSAAKEPYDTQIIYIDGVSKIVK
jgi:Polysaccharide lyase